MCFMPCAQWLCFWGFKVQYLHQYVYGDKNNNIHGKFFGNGIKNNENAKNSCMMKK